MWARITQAGYTFSAAMLLLLLAFSAVAADEGSPWFTDFAKAKEAAAKENKLIFMDIYADWCPPCKLLEEHTFSDDGVKKLLSEFVLMKVNADKQMELVEAYSDGSLPTLVMLDAEGNMLDSTMGFLDPAAFTEWVGQARNAKQELEALVSKVTANPDDVEAALDLANRYVTVRQGARAAEVLAKISPEAVDKLSPENQAQLLFTKAMASFEASDYDASVATFREFKGKFPNDPRVGDMDQYILRGIFLGAREAFRAGDLDRAKAGYTELSADTTIPGAAEIAKVELERIEKFGKPGAPLDIAEWAAGKGVTLSELKGKVVLLDFFQIADPGTDISRPAIAALLHKHASAGLEAVGIAIAFDEQDKQTPSMIKTYVSDHEYIYPVGIDKDMTSTFLAYTGMGSPWTAILDRNGNLAYLDFFEEERITAKIEALLSEPVRN